MGSQGALEDPDSSPLPSVCNMYVLFNINFLCSLRKFFLVKFFLSDQTEKGKTLVGHQQLPKGWWGNYPALCIIKNALQLSHIVLHSRKRNIFS